MFLFGFVRIQQRSQQLVPFSGPSLNSCMPAPVVPLCCSAFHYVRYMGPQVVLLGIDMRSQRSKDRILPEVGGLTGGWAAC